MEMIVGDKVWLRPVSMDDVTGLYLSWLNDDDVTRGLETVPKPYTMEMLKQYVIDMLANENTYMFILVDAESKKDIGTAKIHNINKKHSTCNLGLMIGEKSFWGKGYGQAAYAAAINFAFNQLNIRKIWEAANSNNVGSLAMCKKAGFEIEGQLKEQVLSDGKYVDKILLGLFNKNYKY